MRSGIVGKYPDGHQLQCKMTENGGYSLIEGTIPSDDTVPQNSEGTEIMTQAITASSVTNTFLVMATVSGSPGANDTFTMALFKDSDAGAVATAATGPIDTRTGPLTLMYNMTTGSISEVTFKIRGGCTWTTWRLNSNTTSRVYSGTIATTLTIYEIVGSI